MISRPTVLISNGYYSNFVLFEMEKVFDTQKWFYGKSARSSDNDFYAVQTRNKITILQCFFIVRTILYLL